MIRSSYDAIIVGGGFYGLCIALHLKEQLEVKDVLVLEKEAQPMTRASYNNQARVHNGYHYPRSLLTALRSRVNFADFTSAYAESIDSSFDKYYAVGRAFSKVSAQHFYLFCKRFGAEIEVASAEIKKLFNDDMIEDVFRVKEYAFDSVKLQTLIMRRLEEAGVECRFGVEALSLQRRPKGGISLRVKELATDQEVELRTSKVFNCAYAHINQLNHNSGLPLIQLKHELTEMALIDVPDELKKVGITIVDGPFFSVMPFPARELHTLSHVRYTPHVEWHDRPGDSRWRKGHDYLTANKPATAFYKMMADARRYIPVLGKARHADSLWEVKTILTSAEHDDARPILFVQSHGGIDGYICIMGAKIDNVQDVLGEVDSLYGG